MHRRLKPQVLLRQSRGRRERVHVARATCGPLVEKISCLLCPPNFILYILLVHLGTMATLYDGRFSSYCRP